MMNSVSGAYFGASVQFGLRNQQSTPTTPASGTSCHHGAVKAGEPAIYGFLVQAVEQAGGFTTTAELRKQASSFRGDQRGLEQALARLKKEGLLDD